MSYKITLLGDYTISPQTGLTADVIVTTALGCVPFAFPTQCSTVTPQPLQWEGEAFQAKLEETLQKTQAVKIGIVQKPELITKIAEGLRKYTGYVIVNLILQDRKGTRLISEALLEAYQKELFPRSDVIVLNVPDAELLTGMEIFSDADLIAAGEALKAKHNKTFLICGGQLSGDQHCDYFADFKEPCLLTFTRPKEHSNYVGSALFATAVTVAMGRGIVGLDGIEFARQFIEEVMGRGKEEELLLNVIGYSMSQDKKAFKVLKFPQ